MIEVSIFCTLMTPATIAAGVIAVEYYIRQSVKTQLTQLKKGERELKKYQDLMDNLK